MKFLMIENYPNDSRVRISEDGVCQSLHTRMGTGGNNVPLVLCFTKQRRAKDKDDFETWIEGGVANTLNTFDVAELRATNLVVRCK